MREARRLVQAGSFDEAAKICEAVSARFPRAAEPFAVMAETLLHGNTAVRALRVLSHIPAADRNGEVEVLTAEAHLQLGAYRPAVEAAERVSDKDGVAVLARAARVLAAAGRTERAVSIFQKVHERDPASVRADLAASLHVQGDVQGAEALYRNLIMLGVDKPLAWLSLSQLRQGAIDAKGRAQIEEELALSTNVNDALLYAHALAKSYEDEGDFERALATLAAPKRVKRMAFEYDFNAYDAPLFGAAKASVNVSGASAIAAQPIFVVGMPRTGTTLFERILASHADVESIGEADAFARAIKRTAKANYPGLININALGAGLSAAPEAVGQSYLAQAADRAMGGKARFVDKLPLNFFFAGLIHKAMPNARIVCVRRGAMDSIVANYMQFVRSDSVRYAYQFDLADTARYYAAFDDLCAHWRTNLPASRFSEFQYERLVANQEAETRRLLEFCGLSWDPRCLAFHENPQPAVTASSLQVRQPINAASVGRWKRYGQGVAPALQVLQQFGIAPERA